MDVKSKIAKVRNNSGIMRYLTNTSWLLGEKLLRMTVGLFVGIWVARYLGPEQFGLFSYTQSFVALFIAFSTLGLDSILIRELVKDESERDQLLGTAFVLKLIGSFIVLLFLWVVLILQAEDSYTSLLIFIIASATILQSFNVIDFYFQSKVLSKYVAFCNVFSLLLSSIIKVFLIFNEAPLLAFVYIILFDNAVLASGFIYFYVNRKLSICNWVFKKSIAVYLLKNSWPLILSTLVISMYMKIDQVMINGMLGSYEVGQYAAAVRISEVWYFIPMVIASSLFPAIINAKKTSEKLYLSRIQHLFDLMAWLAIIIAIPMSFLSDWLILLLYGKEYSEASGVLMLHIWSAVFVFLGVASSKWFVTEGLQKHSLYRTTTGVILNVGLNLILIPKLGIYGAAIATLVAQIFASYLLNVFFRKSRILFKLQTNSLLLPFRKVGIKFG